MPCLGSKYQVLGEMLQGMPLPIVYDLGPAAQVPGGQVQIQQYCQLNLWHISSWTCNKQTQHLPVKLWHTRSPAAAKKAIII